MATWTGDVTALLEAYRNGDRSPVDEVEATLEAIEASELNCFSYVDAAGARAAAAAADVSLPLGGVPIGVKELHHVAGWPATEASLVFADRIAEHDDTMITRLRDAGAILIGLTTASEFGGLNVGVTPLNGVTRNPWDPARTPGGSSGGSAAAVAGGLVPIATGGDGGGSIRIPAGFCGLVGLKGTAGRIPRGPRTQINPMTVVAGCLARSTRDAALYYDVCAGYDMRDPYSLPARPGWVDRLDTSALSGLRVAICPDLGSAQLHPGVAERVATAGSALAADAGMVVVDLDMAFPPLGFEWAVANQITLRSELGDLWPWCKGDLTPAISLGVDLADRKVDLELMAAFELERTAANERMAAVFDEVDLVISATNPDVAFPAEVKVNTRVAGEKAHVGNNGVLTIPANISGNPAISVPVGFIDDAPVGMQIMGRHHDDGLLLDVARVVERTAGWPLVASARS